MPTPIENLTRANNEKLSVSGMLFYKDGNFMQVLEGEEAIVKDLYAQDRLRLRDIRRFSTHR